MERYAFSSEWQVLLDSQDGLRLYHNRNDSDILSSFAARVLITLILELTWGILLFGLRGPAQRDLIGKVNLATQIILNLGLCYGTLYLGPMWGNFLYFALEVLVFSVESLLSTTGICPGRGQKASPHLLCADRQSPFLRHRAGIEHPLHQHTDPADRACLSGVVVRRAVALSKAAESAKCTIKRKIFVKNQSCCAPENPL